MPEINIDREQVRRDLGELAWRLARQQLGLGPADAPFSQYEDLTDPDRNRQVRLAVLTASEVLRAELDRKIRDAAQDAAAAGADYGDLGEAASITRQGARRRWPGLAEVAKTARATAAAAEGTA